MLRYVLCARLHGKWLVITFEMHFVSSLALEVFGQTCWYTFSVLAVMGWVWTTHVEIHFESLLAWEGFGQHMLMSLLSHRWHSKGLLYTSSDAFFVLAGMGELYSTHVEIQIVSSLAWDGFGHTCWGTCWVLIGMEEVLSTHDEIHFVSSLAWERIGQHMLRCNFVLDRMGSVCFTHVRYMLSPRWHRIILINTKYI